MDFNVFSKLNKYKGLSINENEPIEFYTKLSTKEYIKLLEIFKNINIEDIIPYRIGNHRSFYKVVNNEYKAQKSFDKLLNNF